MNFEVPGSFMKQSVDRVLLLSMIAAGQQPRAD